MCCRHHFHITTIIQFIPPLFNSVVMNINVHFLYFCNSFCDNKSCCFVDVKRKALPLWIREGLEKIEKEKQKKQEQKSSGLNTSTSSLSSISGYKHSSAASPVPSPKQEESEEVLLVFIYNLHTCKPECISYAYLMTRLH